MKRLAPLLLLLFALMASLALGGEFGNLRLTPIGGYRLPSYTQNDLGVRSTDYAVGDIAVHTFDDGRLVVWHENGDLGKSFVASSIDATTPPGDPSVDPQKWPLLKQASSDREVWTQQELYADRGPKEHIRPAGVLYDPAGDCVWFGVDIWYHTQRDPEQWLAVVDRKTGDVLRVTPKVPLPMHKFSGGFGLIPEAFAEKHLGGKRFGFMAGGYRSGQGAAIGPTLAAMSLEPSETPEAVRLLDHLATAEVGALTKSGVNVPPSGGVPEAPADYSTNMGWLFNPVDGVGYWSGGNARGCWLSVPGFEGVVYLTAYGRGHQTYDAQVEGGGAPLANLLYVYRPDHFAKVAAGERKPLGSPRDAYDFYPFDATEKGIGGRNPIARGITVDASTGLVWVCYPRGWKAEPNNPTNWTRYPVVVAYRAEAVDAPAPEPGPEPYDDSHLREAIDGLRQEVDRINQRLDRAAKALEAN